MAGALVPHTFRLCRADAFKHTLHPHAGEINVIVDLPTSPQYPGFWEQLMRHVLESWNIPYQEISDIAWHLINQPCHQLKPFAGVVRDDTRMGFCLHVLGRKEALVLMKPCRLHCLPLVVDFELPVTRTLGVVMRRDGTPYD